MAFIIKENKHDVSVNSKLGLEKYRTIISAGNKEIIGDEPESLGGNDLGFNPYELLASALSMCTAATLRAYTSRKEIEVGEINVRVDFSNDAINKVATFTKNISFENQNLDEKTLVKLKTIAESCPVNKILTHSIEVSTNLEGVS